MIVAKFGGTSVSSKESLLTLAGIVASKLEKQPVIVVSALSGVTDTLLSLPQLPKSKLTGELARLKRLHDNLVGQVLNDKAKQKEVSVFCDSKIKELALFVKNKNSNKSFLDKLASYGEIMSSFLVAQILSEKGIKAMQIVATDLIITNDNFGLAEFLQEPTQKRIKKILPPLISSGVVPVVTGFIGSTKYGDTTTLGRGGSDYTASIIGFCLGVQEIQIWTDVDGIFTTDPNLVEKAKPLSVISFKEASELATFGVRVLHPRTIKPAISANIPVRVLNTLNPKAQGTLIIKDAKSSHTLRAISFKRKIVLINICSENMLLQKGFLVRIFKIFAQNNISVDLVSVSEVSVSVTLDNSDNLESAVKQISEFASTSVSKNFGMISLIGEGVSDSTLMVKKIFNTLDKENIPIRMISLGATSINISLVIESEQIEQAVKALHRRLF